MATRRPFWKWRCWKAIGFCLWPPSTCIWNLKLKFQRKLDLCSGNHVVYRQTDGRTDRRTDGQGESSIPPSNFVGRGYKNCKIENIPDIQFQLHRSQNIIISTSVCYQGQHYIKKHGANPKYVIVNRTTITGFWEQWKYVKINRLSYT